LDLSVEANWRGKSDLPENSGYTFPITTVVIKVNEIHKEYASCTKICYVMFEHNFIFKKITKTLLNIRRIYSSEGTLFLLPVLCLSGLQLRECNFLIFVKLRRKSDWSRPM